MPRTAFGKQHSANSIRRTAFGEQGVSEARVRKPYLGWRTEPRDQGSGYQGWTNQEAENKEVENREVSENIGRRLRNLSRWEDGGEAGPILEALIRWSGLAAVTTVLSVAAWLAVRRCMASPSLPSVSAPIAAVGGLAIVALVTLVRHSRSLELSHPDSPASLRPAITRILAAHLPHALLTLTTVLFAVALSVPGQPTWSVLGLWTLVTATETWAWRSRFAITHLPGSDIRPEPFDRPTSPSTTLESLPPRMSQGPDVDQLAYSAAHSTTGLDSDTDISSVSTAGIDGDGKATIEDVENAEANARSRARQSLDRRLDTSSEQLAGDDAEIAVDQELEPEELCEGDEEQALPAGVTQQWTRGGCAVQGEWIEVLTRVAWEPGQRNAVVHLAFCPPLTTTPLVHAHVVEGVPADVTVAERRPYGARLELRIKQPIAIQSDSVVLARAETMAETRSETGGETSAEAAG